MGTKKKEKLIKTPLKNLLTFWSNTLSTSKTEIANQKRETYPVLSTTLKPVVTFAIIATTFTSVKLSATGFGLAVIRTSPSTECWLPWSIIAVSELNLNDRNNDIVNNSNELLRLLIIYKKLVQRILIWMKKKMSLYVLSLRNM